MIEKNDLIQLINTAKMDLSSRDGRIDRHRALYEMRHYDNDMNSPSSSPTQRPRKINEFSYQSNKPTNTIDLTVGMMANSPISVKAYTYREDQPSNIKAAQIEKLLSGIITMNGIEQESDIHHDVIHNASLDGAVAVRCVWVTDGVNERKPDKPEDKRSKLKKLADAFTGAPAQAELPDILTGNPIKIHVIPIKNMLYVAGGPKGRWALQAYRNMRTIFDVQKEFPEFRKETTNVSALMSTKVEFLDVWYWSACRCEDGSTEWKVCNACLAANELLRNDETVYPDLPYTIAFFRPNFSEKPSNWGLGELFPIEDDVRYLEDRISQEMRMLALVDNLNIVTKTRDGRQVQLDSVYGTPINLTLEESISYLQPQGQAPDHDRLVAQLQESIQEGTYPPISYGSGNSRSAGYAISLLSEQARIRLTQPTRQINLMWTITARKALALYRLFAPDKALEVYGTYKGQRFVQNDLKGSETEGFMVDLTIAPRFPQDEQRQAAMGTQLLSTHALSRRTIMERFLNVDDPDAEEERLRVEAYEQNPQLVQAILADTARRYGIELPEQNPQGSPPRVPISSPALPGPDFGVLPPQQYGMPPPGQEATPFDLERAQMAQSGQGLPPLGG